MSQCLNPACGQINLPEQKFCSKCGSKLLLADRYRATTFLGQGGFGKTFKAIDEYRLQTLCVIKQFLPLHQGTKALQKSKELFEQEAIQLCELGKHPQIPDLLAFFEQEGRLYLVQDLIEGEDLLKELTHKKNYSELEIKDFLQQLLPVLQFIHEKNVIHRDIKPENIIRRKINQLAEIEPLEKKENDLVLIDFGVSKQLSGTMLNQIGTITGTHGYAPPEQLRGIIHPSSDIYSLALTAIRLLTGCLPLEQNGSIVDPIFDVKTMKWVWQEWLIQHQIKVSSELLSILDKMLQEKIRDRFQTAQEALEALNSPVINLNLTANNNIEESPPSFGEMIGGYWQKTVQLVKEKIHHPPAQTSNLPVNPLKITSHTPPPQVPAKSQSPQSSQSIPTLNPQIVVNTPSPQPSPTVISRKSSLGIDYSNLEKILAQKQWKEADITTYQLLLKISGRQKEKWLRPTDVSNLSSIDLQTINYLWSQYSQKRFCFTTQKQIYRICKGTSKYDEKIWNLFAEKVGWYQQEKWLNYHDLNFALTAPIGHLPFGGWLYRLQNVNRPAIFIALLCRSDL